VPTLGNVPLTRPAEGRYPRCASAVSPNEPTTPALSTLPRERWPLALAGAGLVAGLALLAFAVVTTLGGGSAKPAAAAPPAAPSVLVATPTASRTAAVAATTGADATPAGSAQHAISPVAEQQDLARFARNDRVHVRADWVSRFYPIYEIAQREFGVNWLLIASVHKQETGFSTHPTTYHGLNFARCCAGPMQFNVTNGPVTTWARYRGAFRRAARPGGYPNQTRRHPSIYDDFDAIMAGAKLLRDAGAGTMLDASAWRAAYDYYGHDPTGVSYANEVVARAIGWGQRRFCINCGTDAGLLGAVDGAWGAPVRATLVAPAPEPGTKAGHRHRARHPQALAASRRAAAHRRAATPRRTAARQPARDR
jgi:hypothetical protein